MSQYWSAAVEGDPLALVTVGELDVASVDDVAAAFMNYLALDVVRHPILDLSRLTFIDSSGLKALFRAGQLCDGQLLVRRPSAYMRLWLEIRSGGYFAIEPTGAPPS